MKFMSSIKAGLSKNSNLLFCIGEIALGTAAVIFAVKNTEKYIYDIDGEEEDRAIHEQKRAKILAEHYWQTGVCLVGFIALRSIDCVYSNKVRDDYAKALLAAQSALLAKNHKKPGQTQNDTDKKEVGPQGDKMERIRDENAYDEYAYRFFFKGDELPEAEVCVLDMSNQKTDLFYIPSLGVLFYSNLTDVRNAENECMLQLSSGSDMTVNEMMKYLGLGSRPIGNVEYYQGDPEDDEVCGDFCFDLAPAMIEQKDGSTYLMYTINPNRTLRNCIFA